VDTKDPSLAYYGFEDVQSLSIDTSNALQPEDSKSRKGLGSGSIIAIAVAVPVAALLLIGGVFLVMRKKRAPQNSHEYPLELNNVEPNKKPVDEEKATPSVEERKPAEKPSESEEESSSSSEESEQSDSSTTGSSGSDLSN